MYLDNLLAVIIIICNLCIILLMKEVTNYVGNINTTTNHICNTFTLDLCLGKVKYGGKDTSFYMFGRCNPVKFD